MNTNHKPHAYRTHLAWLSERGRQISADLRQLSNAEFFAEFKALNDDAAADQSARYLQDLYEWEDHRRGHPFLKFRQKLRAKARRNMPLRELDDEIPF